jgi:chaperone BCS1
MESVTLTALTQRKDVLQNVLQEAKQLALKDEEGKTVVYTSWGQEWRQFGYPRRRRPLQSVILDKGVAERIVADVDDFLHTGSWYIERGKIIASSHKMLYAEFGS